MIKLLILFAHLLAVCAAVGAIIATDLRVAFKLMEPRARLAPPNNYVTGLVAGSLLVLYITGCALVWLGLQDDADYLANPKLQAKVLLVGLLTLNAVLLHRYTFAWLATARRVSAWRFSESLRVAVPVAASNSLWLYSAFLGIARPWNFVMPVEDVLTIAAGFFLAMLVCVLGALMAVARPGSIARTETPAMEKRVPPNSALGAP